MAATASFKSSAVDATNKTASGVYTFSSMVFTGEASDRYGLAYLGCRSSSVGTPDIASVTIAGQAATRIATRGTAGVTRSDFFITDAPVTTGTTATVIVTLGSGAQTIQSCGVALFALFGISSTTPSDTAGATGSTTHTLTFDIAASGVGVAGITVSSGTNRTITWSGTSGVVEDNDEVAENGSSSFSTATGSTAGTNVTAIATFSGSITLAESLAVAFSPVVAAGQPYDLHDGGVKFVNTLHGGSGFQVWRKMGELLFPPRRGIIRV